MCVCVCVSVCGLYNHVFLVHISVLVLTVQLDNRTLHSQAFPTSSFWFLVVLANNIKILFYGWYSVILNFLLSSANAWRSGTNHSCPFLETSYATFTKLKQLLYSSRWTTPWALYLDCLISSPVPSPAPWTSFTLLVVLEAMDKLGKLLLRELSTIGNKGLVVPFILFWSFVL